MFQDLALIRGKPTPYRLSRGIVEEARWGGAVPIQPNQERFETRTDLVSFLCELLLRDRLSFIDGP